MAIFEEHDFGTCRDGHTTKRYCLGLDNGVSASICDYGASLVDMSVPDRIGTLENICIGFNTVSDYETQCLYLGAIVGRYANRIGGARYEKEGKYILLDANEGNNVLHGGRLCLSRRCWLKEAFALDEKGNPTLLLSTYSPDGENGFPGNVEVKIRFTLKMPATLQVDMTVHSDAITPISLTHHPYLNLNGANDPDAHLAHHHLRIHSHSVTEVNEQLVPTGKLIDIRDSVFDFSKAKALSSVLDPLTPELEATRGIDHNYCFEGWQPDTPLRVMAEVWSTLSGRSLEVWSDLPGLQCYSGNHLSDIGLPPQSALCLEPQFYPDSPNHKHFPFYWTCPDQPYQQRIEWRFGARP